MNKPKSTNSASVDGVNLYLNLGLYFKSSLYAHQIVPELFASSTWNHYMKSYVAVANFNLKGSEP